ncbi:F-box protein-like protein [Tanacetum coccineum]
MSDNIPFKIQTEIIKRVSDVKSLLRLRSVSKQWKSFIDSPQFIAGYGARKTQPHTLLLRYQEKFQVKYLSVNNDTLTQQQDLVPNASTLMKHLRELEVIGYSRGLLCLYGTCTWSMFVLWNPSIRRSVGIVHHNITDGVFGFAVCPVTNEPTIVKYSYPWIIGIFTLGSKRWTQIKCSKPSKSIQFHERSHGRSQVVIGSCIYRVSYESILVQNGYYTHKYMIVSFDLNAKEFKAIDFPDTITNQSYMPARLFISKLRESLVLCLPNTQNDEVILETFREEAKQFGIYDSAVEVYKPWSRNIIKFPIYGQRNSFFISSYKETLLLLDHLDSSVYDDDCEVMVFRSDMLSHH